MKVLARVFSILKNKYIISALLFVVWMLFFDPKDWFLIEARKEKLKELEKSQQHFTRQIEVANKERDMLKTSAATMEKYARENFWMKKDNEDLFIVNTP